MFNLKYFNLLLFFFFGVFKRCSLWKFAQTVHDLKGFFSAVTTIFPWRGPVIENETSIMLLNTPYTKRWITIASTIWCTLYISFLLKRNFVYSFVETQTSLSRNKMGNKYNHVCVLMSTGYRHLKHVKKRLKTPESASYMDPFQKSAGLQ